MNQKRERNFSNVAEAVDFINEVNAQMYSGKLDCVADETPKSSLWTWTFVGVLTLYREALGIASLNNALPPMEQLNAVCASLQDLGRKIPKVDIEQALVSEYNFMIGRTYGFDDNVRLTARVISSINLTLGSLALINTLRQ